MDRMLKKEDIPQGLIDEISSYYQTVKWDDYGLTSAEALVAGTYDQWRSRRPKFQRLISNAIVEAVVPDPVTFEPTPVSGRPAMNYIIRGLFDEEAKSAVIYQVIETMVTVQ